MTPEAAALLTAVRENAERALPDALSLPPAIYHNAEIYNLEIQRLFHRGWICIGRAAEVPEAGDFVSLDIVGQPVFVVRQKDSSIKGFQNLCLHRCSRLLSGSGHVSRISCPYHSWTYELSGQLVGAPFMHKTAGFDVKNYKLIELPCEVWQGFIYISLNQAAPSISQQLSGLVPHIEDFRMHDYVPVYEEHEVWNTNWKCLVENFMDVYHLHRVHADSFNKYSSFENVTEMFSGEDAYSYMFVQEDGGPHSVKPHPTNSWLSPEKHFRTYLFNTFPSHVVQLQPDLLWYLTILPDGLDKVRIRWAVSIPREYLDNAEDRDAHIKEELDLLLQVNSEDRPAVERVFQGTKLKNAPQGPLSWLEHNVWDFGRYLARELS